MSSDLNKTIDKVLSDEREVRAATAPFQAEFPFERDDEAQVTRREFCNFLFLTSSALLVSSAGVAAKAAYDRTMVPQFQPMQIEGAAALQPGNSLNFFYPSE